MNVRTSNQIIAVVWARVARLIMARSAWCAGKEQGVIRAVAAVAYNRGVGIACLQMALEVKG
jgi:hypothetical protein